MWRVCFTVIARWQSITLFPCCFPCGTKLTSITDKRPLKRAHTTTTTSSSTASAGTSSTTTYKGELNMLEVREGYGMGMAVKKVGLPEHLCSYFVLYGIRSFILLYP